MQLAINKCRVPSCKGIADRSRANMPLVTTCTEVYDVCGSGKFAMINVTRTTCRAAKVS